MVKSGMESIRPDSCLLWYCVASPQALQVATALRLVATQQSKPHATTGHSNETRFTSIACCCLQNPHHQSTNEAFQLEEPNPTTSAGPSTYTTAAGPSTYTTVAATPHQMAPAPSPPHQMAPAPSPPHQMASVLSPRWVILGTVPRVTAADADMLPPGADLSVALPAPPRVALLTIPARFFPGEMTPATFPYIVAADSTGLLLLSASQGAADAPTVIDTPGHKEYGWRPTKEGYFILDATTLSAFPLPNPEMVLHKGYLGLISSPGGGGLYMIVELQRFTGSDRALLLCYSSKVGAWESKALTFPLPGRQMAPDSVVSHHGRLWWVDLSWCLLTCDPFEESPVLMAVSLPPGKELACTASALDKYRCVRVSAGKLRFVDMYHGRSNRAAPRISIWTLSYPESMEWKLDCVASFEQIWNDSTYKSLGLPMKIPVLALIHPNNPDVVYFFLDEHLIGIDVRTHHVVAFEEYKLIAPPSPHVSSRFVRAWQLPRALCR